MTTDIHGFMRQCAPRISTAAEYDATGKSFERDHQADFLISDENSNRAFVMTMTAFGEEAIAFEIGRVMSLFQVSVLFKKGSHATSFYARLPERITPAVILRHAKEHPALRSLVA